MKKVDKPSKYDCFQKASWITVAICFGLKFFLDQRGWCDIPPLFEFIILISIFTQLYSSFWKEATCQYESYIAYEARENKKIELMVNESDENKRLTFSRAYDRLPSTENENKRLIFSRAYDKLSFSNG